MLRSCVVQDNKKALKESNHFIEKAKKFQSHQLELNQKKKARAQQLRHERQQEKKVIEEDNKRIDQMNQVDLKALCAELKIDPSKARNKMRKHSISKPYVWSDDKTINQIKKLLTNK